MNDHVENTNHDLNSIKEEEENTKSQDDGLLCKLFSKKFNG